MTDIAIPWATWLLRRHKKVFTIIPLVEILTPALTDVNRFSHSGCEMSFKHSTDILSLYNHLYCAVVMFSLWRIKQTYHALNYANYEEWGWNNISIFLWATVTLPPTSSSQTLQQWVIMRCHYLYNEYTMIYLKSREVCPLQRTLNWMGKNTHRVGVVPRLWCGTLKFTFPFS